MALHPTIVVLALVLCAFPSAKASPHINGWTESTSQEYVHGCVSFYGEKQMDNMFRSGQIKQGATVADLEAAQAQVTAHATATCKCAQDRAMHDFKVEDSVRKGQQPAYMEKILAACAGEALKEGQLPGASATASTPTTGPASTPNPDGETGYKVEVLVGFFLLILALAALAVWVGWLIFRRTKGPR